MGEGNGSNATSEICRLDLALRRLQNDRPLLIELAKIFFEDRQKIWDELKSGIQRSDDVAVRRAAHTLKGLVSNFDAGPAERGCLAVEESAAKGQLSEAASLLPELYRRLDQVESYLRSELRLND